MKKKNKKIKNKNKQKVYKSHKKNLRAGSKQCKRILYEQNPRCDICGCRLSISIIQFHHIYMIRHGFSTQIDHACLLCPTCHRKFHKKFDKYFDRLFEENPNTDFLKVYNECKKHLD